MTRKRRRATRAGRLKTTYKNLVLAGIGLVAVFGVYLLAAKFNPATPSSQTTIAPNVKPPAEPIRAPLREPQASPSSQPQIAIILDDLGDRLAAGEQAVRLPGDVTLALLPFSPYSAKLAALAQAHNKETMLHAPMEPLQHRAWAGGLSLQMDRTELQTSLRKMLAAVPGVRGVNNHMGSALTQNHLAMTWVMETLRAEGLYFVDSRTSAKTQALNAAQLQQIPSARRDVFLDNNRDPAAIATQLAQLVRLARVQGFAVAIGHPYSETLSVLETFLPSLPELGVQLVRASTILPKAQAHYTKQHSGDKEAATIKAPLLHSKSI